MAVLVCVAWAVLAGTATLRTLAAAEYALTASEARSVAESMNESWQPRRTPVRSIEAAGRITPVVRTMERRVGAAARRIATDDRVLVLDGGFFSYVSVPVKDADQWEIVGAVVIRAGHTPGWKWAWLALLVAPLVAALRVGRGLRRLSDPKVRPGVIVLDCATVFAAATVALVYLLRTDVQRASESLPPDSVATRFDPLHLALPSIQLAVLQLVVAALLAAGVLFLVTWSLSPRQPAGHRRESITAWGFLAPGAVHLAVFTLGPLLFTGWLSLHDWDLLAPARPFVGLANYRELARDALFWKALGNTAVYSLYVPVTMALALGAALLLNQPLRGVRVLRAIVFVPTVISYVAIAMVWQWMYHADYGVINHLLRVAGADAVDWLGNPRTALLAVMIVSAWVQVGYQMIVYLAGLQGIPEGLHEAARLDGATPWARFRHITVPLLHPVSLYLFITGIIWSFQVFALVYVMTEGGPVHSTDVLVYRIYQNAWEFRRMGYASAMSWVLFVILVGLTAAQWRLLNRKVAHVA